MRSKLEEIQKVEFGRFYKDFKDFYAYPNIFSLHFYKYDVGNVLNQFKEEIESRTALESNFNVPYILIGVSGSGKVNFIYLFFQIKFNYLL